MVSKYLRLLLLCLFINFYSCLLFAQNSEIANPAGDSLSGNLHNDRYLKPSALIIPGAFLIYGGLKPVVTGIHKIDDTLFNHILKNYPNFHTNAEDYLMWVPSASVYMLDAFKAKTKHNFKEHLILDAGSIVITGGIGYAMRIISKHISSYDEYNTKFPSGHTANAFRGAEILHQELKNENEVLSYSGYVVATTVGVLRIYNKAHLLTQVLAGAGLGILSTKLTYWIFDKAKYSKRNSGME